MISCNHPSQSQRTSIDEWTHDPSGIGHCREGYQEIKRFDEALGYGRCHFEIEVLIVVVTHRASADIDPLALLSSLDKKHRHLGAQLSFFPAICLCASSHKLLEEIVSGISCDFWLAPGLEDKLIKATWPGITLFLRIERQPGLQAYEEVARLVVTVGGDLHGQQRSVEERCLEFRGGAYRTSGVPKGRESL
jgi:hypothetical protein